MNKKNIKLIGFAVIGLLMVAVIFVSVLPLVTQAQTHAQEVTEAEEGISQLEDQAAGLVATQEQSDAIQAINTSLASKFPNIQNGSDLLNNISSAALASGLSASQITSITIDPPTLVAPPVSTEPAPEDAASTDGETPVDAAEDAADATEEASGATDPTAGAADPAAEGGNTSNLASMNISMTVEGQTDQLELFMINLSNITRTIKVESFTYSGGDGETLANLSIVGTGFLYAPITPPVPPAE